MKRSRALSCPLCGGAASAPVDSRLTQCEYCDRRLFYTGDDFIPRMVLKPRFDETYIQSRFFSGLKGLLLPRGLPSRAFVLQKARRYVPFYLLTGKRGGVLDTVKERIVQDPSRGSGAWDTQGGAGMGGYYARQQAERVSVETTPDSRVVLGDFRYLYGAAVLQDLDIPGRELEDILERNLDIAEAARMQELSSSGEIIEATVPVKRVVQKGVESWQNAGEGVSVIEMDVRLVYVPVIEIVFRYGEEIYTVHIDEIEGALLSGHLPFRKEWAILAGVPLTAGLGFIVGKTLRSTLAFVMASGGRTEDTFAGIIWVGFFFMILLSIGLNLAWLLLRTPFHIKVLPGGQRRIAQASPVPRGPFTALSGFVTRALDQAIRGGSP